MARYPLTNAQYSLFIQADGYNYEHREWWTDEGWQACLDGWIEPAYWTHSNFNDDHKPVVGVSWYEVIAYCTWLNENLKKSLLNSVYEITLPTEQQWQRAAQADDKRKYPWGNKLDETRTNIAFSRFGGATSLVTKYPDSASPYGVMDLYGNVWEWCLNEYKDRKKVELNGSNYRAIRGSSFMSTREATITKREGESPSVRSNKIGFRLCAVPKQANS